jgi:hypothetical protein
MLSVSSDDVEPVMNHRRAHWLEKLSVQAVTVAALAAMYFGLWPHVQPSDPQMPVSFFAAGGGNSLSVFIGIAAVTAALVGALTISARPVGAVMSALLGVGGLALRSQSFRGLLWSWQGDPSHPHELQSMYGRLIAEVVVLTAVAVMVAMIVLLARQLVRLALPGSGWRDPLADAIAPAPRGTPLPKGFLDAAMKAMGLDAVDYTIPCEKDSLLRIRPSTPELLKRLASCLAMAGVIACALLLALMRSDDRGQTIFAVLASFTVAVLIAHYTTPSPYPLVAWVLPLVLGVAFYVMGSMTPTEASPQDWTNVPRCAHALPIDWMTFGIGGGLLGYWFSARLHEAKHIEYREARDEP